ncbi:centromere protein S-like [Pectinophora gossypiella]|uniref:centromere protein S-like n=1 Tax=Pectinophora gossypiella TaxID=13191 RepID=UPI00214E0E8D|nr:centromere protein S-like [Pectinophora gossypiella]
MTNFEKLTNPQKVRAALHRDVRAIASETCHFLGLEVTKPAMEIIAELVYKKISVYATDIEAFAKHAKRTTINAEDVKLLARRNPSLLAHLNTTAPTNPVAPKRRKTAVKPQETPAKNKDDSDKNKETTRISDNKEVEQHKKKVHQENKIDDFVDNMILDTTIDLTFD